MMNNKFLNFFHLILGKSYGNQSGKNKAMNKSFFFFLFIIGINLINSEEPAKNSLVSSENHDWIVINDILLKYGLSLLLKFKINSMVYYIRYIFIALYIVSIWQC